MSSATGVPSEDSLAPVLPRLVAGLGNPGGRYEGTRHNVGFAVVDRLVSARGETWAREKRWECLVARGGNVTFIKPATFMNLSGRAVSAVARFFKIAPEEVLLLHDDADLPLGKIRLRPKGSAGGHNGLKSVFAELGTEDIPRLKVGIGRVPELKGGMVDHVLGRFDPSEREILEKTLQESVRAVECALDRGLVAAMNEFNRKEEAKKPKRETEKLPESPAEGETGVQDDE